MLIAFVLIGHLSQLTLFEQALIKHVSQKVKLWTQYTALIRVYAVPQAQFKHEVQLVSRCKKKWK